MNGKKITPLLDDLCDLEAASIYSPEQIAENERAEEHRHKILIESIESDPDIKEELEFEANQSIWYDPPRDAADQLIFDLQLDGYGHRSRYLHMAHSTSAQRSQGNANFVAEPARSVRARIQQYQGL